MRKNFFILFLLMAGHAFAQNHEPPEPLNINIEDNYIFELAWSFSGSSIDYYKIYRNGVYYDNLQDTIYRDTVFFTGENTYKISAVYNDGTETPPDSCTFSIAIPIILGFPLIVDFEGDYSIFHTRAINGNSLWQVSKYDNYSGSKSAMFPNSEHGDSALLLTPPITNQFAGKSLANISFHYYLPAEESKQNYLYFLLTSSDNQQVEQCITLPPANTWVSFDTTMIMNPERCVGFAAMAKGNIAKVDDIRIELVHTGNGQLQNNNFKAFVSPNPCKQKTSFYCHVKTSKKYTLKITDINGKMRLQKQGQLQSGRNTISFNTQMLENGLYFATLQTENNLESVKFIKH